MTTTTGRTMRGTPVAAPASRAALAAALAAVVAFSPQHTAQFGLETTARFGLLALGVYLVLQGLLLGAWSRRLARTRLGLVLLLARAAVSLVGGVVALSQPAGGIDVLRPVQIVVFLSLGAMEVAGAVARTEWPDGAGDGVVVGGLQLVVGAMVLILNEDALFSVGVLSAWAALVAVYLGIAAANLRARRRRA